MSKYKVLDLFSGIGMFSYGLHKTELFETTAFVEWDKSCQRVLEKNFKDVPIFGDIKEVSAKMFNSPDVLVGGFPCQDISIAGNGLGLEGKRSGHWYEYARLIEEIKPKGVIIENVSELRNKGLEKVLQQLDALGYDAEWHCITAKHFGAYHERDRIFVLAYNRSNGIKRFEPLQRLEEVGQGWKGREKTMHKIYSDPFRRSHLYPQPLICGMDARSPGRVDRITQVGNTVYWPIVEKLGYHLASNLDLNKVTL